MKNIRFIGYGNIAKAIAQNFVKDLNYSISASSPSLKEGKNDQAITTYSDNLSALKEMDVIFLAIKPNQMEKVLNQIGPSLSPSTVVISLAAGIQISWIQKFLNKNQLVIRCMPNTPIAIGKGATALYAAQAISTEQEKAMNDLFKNTGLITWLSKEEDLNAFTAAFGSGPAYTFYFLEALIEAAKKLGIDEQIAKQFTLQTMHGALHLIQSNSISIEELRAKVTSKGGTTAAAIQNLEHNNFSEQIEHALRAAQQRSKELNG